jgi:hypothetical protein
MDQSIKPMPCWAASLGGCSAKISREHLISKALFPGVRTIEIEGLPWCMGERKSIGLASLTGKMLCAKHNSLLNPLDSAAGHAFGALRDSAVLANKRAAAPATQFKVKKFDLNARLLERWLLKTLINLTHNSELFIGLGGQVKGTPEDDLVHICYGIKPFPGKSGMYVASRVGAKVRSGDVVGFAPLIKDSNRVVGGFFHFRGFLLFLWLMPEEIPDHFDWVPGLQDEWRGCKPSWRFKRIMLRVNNVRSHVVRFNWGG